MLKYVETLVGFREVPDELTLCINISGCPLRCKGCHSPHLQKNIGRRLTPEALSYLIEDNPGITCVSFMGGDAQPFDVVDAAKLIKDNYDLKVCWYRGGDLDASFIDYSYFDYVKTGPYIEKKGGLDSPKTNQRFYKITHDVEGKTPYNMFEDITYKFKRK